MSKELDVVYFTANMSGILMVFAYYLDMQMLLSSSTENGETGNIPNFGGT